MPNIWFIRVCNRLVNSHKCVEYIENIPRPYIPDDTDTDTHCVFQKQKLKHKTPQPSLKGHFFRILSLRHRGLLIDSGRHFEPVVHVKALLDSMSYAKLNVLHWHLTEARHGRFSSLTRILRCEIFVSQKNH